MSHLETVYLDTIDGFEFENLCTKIFERLQWGKVEHIGFVKDGGRDIVIHLPQGGSIVVECKHQPHTSIGRPVVQKLHSAVISSGAIKGILVTTGKFSAEAIEHAKQISVKTPIELVDINGITDLADRSKIRILFSTNYSPIFSFPASDMPTLVTKLNKRFERFQSFPRHASEIFQVIPSNLKLEAKYLVRYDIHEDFSTQVGLIHSINENDVNLLLDAENGSLVDQMTISFLRNTTFIEASQIPALACPTIRTNFVIDKTTLTKMVKSHVIQAYTTKVAYRGRNNVHYQKVCQPGERNVNIKDIKQVLLPRYSLLIRAVTQQYHCSLIQNDNEVNLVSTDIFNCRICNKNINKKILLCNDCGNVSHGPRFFRAHGFVCKRCKKTICRNCAYWIRRFIFFKKILCESCSVELATQKGQSKRKLVR